MIVPDFIGFCFADGIFSLGASLALLIIDLSPPPPPPPPPFLGIGVEAGILTASSGVSEGYRDVEAGELLTGEFLPELASLHET